MDHCPRKTAIFQDTDACVTPTTLEEIKGRERVLLQRYENVSRPSQLCVLSDMNITDKSVTTGRTVGYDVVFRARSKYSIARLTSERAAALTTR